MRLMMFGEKNFTFIVGVLRSLFSYPEFLPKPKRHRHKKGADTLRSIVQICLKEPFKFQQRLIIKGNQVNFFTLDACLLETEIHRFSRETMIVFFSREALFLCGCQNFAAFGEAGCRIVVVSRDTKNVHISLNCRVLLKHIM